MHIDYPIDVDRALGLGELPTLRLQRALARLDPSNGEPSWRTLDKVLVWTHWAWFTVPHGSLAYVLMRQPERFPRAAVMTYAVFDIGASVYWVAPTAPPWYAASVAGREDHGAGAEHVRRMMVEYGEHFWRDGWGPLYSVFGGNPLAAMPSLHFATSLWPRSCSPRRDRLRARSGSAYAAMLGFALVYLGRALRGGPARGRRADRGCAAAGATRGAGDRALRPGGRGAGGDRTRGGLRLMARRSRGAGRSRRRRARDRGSRVTSEEMPRVLVTRRQAVAFGVFVVIGARRSCTSCCPSSPAWARRCTSSSDGRRLVDRDRGRARAAVVRRLRAAVPRGVRRSGVHPSHELSRSAGAESYQITMAGLAATRLFATAGAGGIALTAWALRRSGMERAIGGLPDGRVHGAAVRGLHGLGAGRRGRSGDRAVPRGGSFALTIVPAIVGGGVIAVFGAMALLPDDIERRLQRWALGSGPAGALGGAGGDGAGAGGERGADRDRADRASAIPACWERWPGGGLTSPCCGRASTRSARRRRHGHRDVLLRRHARQPAAAAGRASAASRAA